MRNQKKCAKCSQFAVPGLSLCQYHRDYVKAYQARTRGKKAQPVAAKAPTVPSNLMHLVAKEIAQIFVARGL